MFVPFGLDGESRQEPEAPVVEGKRARSQQQVWKAHEVEILQQGVARYGRNWKAILDDRDFAPTLGGRSAGSLKLKWYKMSKEHEEKMSVNSRLWGMPPGQQQQQQQQASLSMLEGDLGGPFGGMFMDAGYGARVGMPGEMAMFDAFRPDELQALKEGTARYGPNWPAILTDPNYAVPLMNRSPAALQCWWNQLQQMPKPSAHDSGNQDECSSEGGGEGTPEAPQSGLQSMRSWGRLETDALVKGFETYGTDWKAILLDARYRPHLAHRTAHSLKSKWARMMKKRKRDDDDVRQYGGGMQASSMSLYAGSTMPGLGGGHQHPSALDTCFPTAPMHAFGGGAMPSAIDDRSCLQPALDATENYDRSIDEYTKEIAANPANAVLYNHRGVVYYAKGMVDPAIDDFSTAIALDCSYADAFTNRGMAFNSKGEFDLAIMDCTTTIDINPQSASAANAYLTRALTYYNKGMLDECIADCDATLALRPRCVSALVTRGLTVLAKAKDGGHLSSGAAAAQYESALRDFKSAVTIDPSNSQARVWHDEALALLSGTAAAAAEASPDVVVAASGNVSVPADEGAPSPDLLASRFMH
ncbi:Myb-like domain-containing protein [Plasmodiophora brassicae]